MSVGSSVTDTQAHLIFTEENRQQQEMDESYRDKLERDRRKVGDKDKKEANSEKQKL